MLPRIRTVKPEFFRHWELFKAELDTGLPLRVAFAGLWTCCDREGRFPWRPEELKVVVLPHDEVDFARVLDALTTRGFVRKYTVGDTHFGHVPTFAKHQVINNKERPSEIPPPPITAVPVKGSTREARETNATSTRGAREDDACHTGTGTGTGTEGEKPPLPTPSDLDDALDADGLRDLWNEVATRVGWPSWSAGAGKRLGLAKTRLGRHGSRARWAAALERMARSSFLLGREGREGSHKDWRPTADWLLKPDTLAKVEEGAYDDRGGTAATPPPAFDQHGLEIA